MDLAMIEFLCKFGRIFAFTPYSCNNRHPSFFQRCHICLVFAIYTVTFFGVQYVAAPQYSQLTRIQLVLSAVTYTNFYFTNVHILVVVMGLNQNRWVRLIDLLKSIEIRLDTKQFTILKLSLVIFLSLCAFELFVTFYYFGLVTFLLFLPTNIYTYSQFTYSICTCVVLQMVLTRYQHYTKAVLNRTDELFTVLQRVKLGVFTLKKCVNAFNDIFGWTTLGSVFCGTFKCFVYIDVASKHSEVVEMWWGTEGDQLHFLCEIGFIAVMWVGVLAPYLDNSVIALFQTGIVLTIFLSDKILNEFDNLLDLAWQRKGLNPHLDKEFKLFVSFVECNRPRFTAARFFAIDRSTLFKIINSSIGFFLVMIQSY
ncbi:hypothetical protein MTP99_004227 [Tenebrio molitor]|nr:hypothetical protein MTP99_004227 [Tenebrio molitor]